MNGQIESKVTKVLHEFTKTSPMGSITTGMLQLLVKPDMSPDEFSQLLDSLENEGVLIGTPKGNTKRWRLETTFTPDYSI